MPTLLDRIGAKLKVLYGDDQASLILTHLQSLVTQAKQPNRTTVAITEQDVILITYGDQVSKSAEAPLATLRYFLNQTIHDQINTVHILPFYPYSSDDGFSVIDYYAVNPALGDWSHIHDLHQDFRLMFDAVFNHISAQSEWFQAFLRDEAPYNHFFVMVDPNTDLSLVRRPRALPLLTPFATKRGTEHVWTTFSADQIDLNAANPEVLLELIRILLFYVAQGADLIRLDAIGFLWKTIGTDSIHLPETHLIVQLLRDVLDLAAPDTILMTETNVPHHENISYFGDGTNEAQMVYQFSLPPLILHTFSTGDATALSGWATGIQRVSDQTSFFNFTASHDGIGVQPARGILSEAEITALVNRVEAHGGLVSYKHNSDGSRSPYELNISYFDAITHPDVTASQPEIAIQRFLCSQAIMLAFMGVPGVYFHSLFGSRSDHAGVQQFGHNRAINRQKLDADTLLTDLKNPATLRYQVYMQFLKLLSIRTHEPAFHPVGQQTILDYGQQIFALERRSPDGQNRVIALHNVQGEPVEVKISAGGRDLLTGQLYTPHVTITLQPYQIFWLKVSDSGSSG
ncbi:MAG: sugar phosphorylase [Anaerolineae bacterium]|nr:sugar phosphorylase [Anaerolineae bacterium]